MATASSVQREPSMEEILASIRRIIEDSDTGRKPSAGGDDLRQDLEPAPVEKPAVEVEAFRAELRAVGETRKPVTLAEVQAQLAAVEPIVSRVEPVTQPLPEPRRYGVTLADVGAQVAANTPSAPARDVAAFAPAQTPAAASTIVADWRRETAAAAAPAVHTPEEEDAGAETLHHAGSDIEISEDELTAEPAFDPGPVRNDIVWQAASETPPARPAILSEHAGRQVAAAFSELSDAFASRGKKTFDEMAEEMLRPMLQDWLDNNLPTLVERLVREEIERVARGAQ